MLGRRRRRSGRNERGASAVEFALVVMPLLLVLGGIVNFGFAFSQKLALDNAVRETARSAAVDTGKTQTQLASAGVATFNASALGTSSSTATIAVGTCKSTTFGTPVVATGTFTSKFLFPWMVPGIPTSINWQSRGEYVCEYS